MINKKQQIILNAVMKSLPNRSQFSFDSLIKNFDPYKLKLSKSLQIDLDLYKRFGLTEKILIFLYEEGFVDKLSAESSTLSPKGILLKKSGSFQRFLITNFFKTIIGKAILWISILALIIDIVELVINLNHTNFEKIQEIII